MFFGCTSLYKFRSVCVCVCVFVCVCVCVCVCQPVFQCLSKIYNNAVQLLLCVSPGKKLLLCQSKRLKLKLAVRALAPELDKLCAVYTQVQQGFTLATLYQLPCGTSGQQYFLTRGTLFLLMRIIGQSRNIWS